MTLEGVLSVASLAVAIWTMRAQLPRARREGEWFAFACSLLTALAAFGAWLFIGVAAR